MIKQNKTKPTPPGPCCCSCVAYFISEMCVTGNINAYTLALKDFRSNSSKGRVGWSGGIAVSERDSHR